MIRTQLRQCIETSGELCGVKQHHWNTGAKGNSQLNPGGPRNRHKNSRTRPSKE